MKLTKEEALALLMRLKDDAERARRDQDDVIADYRNAAESCICEILDTLADMEFQEETPGPAQETGTLSLYEEDYTSTGWKEICLETNKPLSAKIITIKFLKEKSNDHQV